MTNTECKFNIETIYINELLQSTFKNQVLGKYAPDDKSAMDGVSGLGIDLSGDDFIIRDAYPNA